jgi:hypothetical protein
MPLNFFNQYQAAIRGGDGELNGDGGVRVFGEPKQANRIATGIATR